MEVCEPMGKQEIAVMFHVKPPTVHVWRDRGQLPRPDHESVNGSHAWEKSTMLLWGLRTGRAHLLSEEDQAEAESLLATMDEAS